MEKRTQQGKLTNLEIASFCSEMAMILKSGISSLEGVDLLREDAQTKAEKELLDEIYQSVMDTGRLDQALEETKVFPEYLIRRYSAVFAVLLAVIVCAGIYFTKTESGRKKMYHIGSGFAFSRELKDKLSACRFAGGMSLALKSGLTPEQGMEFSENLIEDDDFRKKVAGCKTDMENGTDIAEALVKAGIFTGVYARMTSIAGKAGMMDEVMGRIADECEEEVDEKLSSMIAVLDPTLVIILSVIVGTILLSVMLPLLGIMSGL